MTTTTGRATARAWVLRGLEIVSVAVTASIGTGAAGLRFPQLPEHQQRESSARVRSALARLGVTVDVSIEVQLEPVPPEVASLDVAVALAVLGALGHVPDEDLKDDVFVGELGLDGTMRTVRGGVPLANAAHRLAPSKLVLPAGNNADAALCEAYRHVRLAETLDDVVRCVRERRRLEPVRPLRDEPARCDDTHWQALQDAQVRRAIEIAAAGGHSLLLVGPPGCGKTLAARALCSLLPLPDDVLEVASIWSVAGLPWPTDVPLRAPHHTVSEAGLIGGGGTVPRPGEVSLAHGGVLFLDELGEFGSHALEALGVVLHEGEVRLGRRWPCSYPARPAVVMAASDPCPCGGARECRCPPDSIRRHRDRLRRLPFDLVVRVPRPVFQRETAVEPADEVRLRVAVAREELALHPSTEPSVARTIAELAGTSLDAAHVAEAQSFGWDASGL